MKEPVGSGNRRSFRDLTFSEAFVKTMLYDPFVLTSLLRTLSPGFMGKFGFWCRASGNMTAQFQQNLLVASDTSASAVLAPLAEEIAPVVAFVLLCLFASLKVGLS